MLRKAAPENAAVLQAFLAEQTPEAMTKLNARAADCVQVGGVYAPPDHRGHGYGGDVVALHLAELADQGMRQAVLFAANDFAARAYQRIGFQQVGAYRVAMFKTPVIVGAARAGLGLGERRSGL